MTVKTATRRETASFPVFYGTKAVDTEAGTFEAIVSVFGNVDYHGHRIDAKAFDASIERWRASGDPIPVIFSHQWDTLSAYLGEASPSDVEALPPGHADLPDAIRELGGLRVRGTIDTDDAEGRKALKLMKTRRVREWSFAYDVFEENKAADGFVDLLELDLIEVGPTLKGANPLTQLIGAKASANHETIGETLKRVADVLGAKASDVAEALGIEDVETKPDRGAKAFVSLPDTVERLQEAITRAAVEWAAELYGSNLYTVQLEGTYPADQRVVLYVELWDDPPYKGRYFEATFAITDGVVELAEPTPVELTATITPAGANSRPFGFKEGRRNAAADADRIQGIHDLTAELGAACADPDGTASEDETEDEDESGEEAIAPARVASAAPGVMRAMLDVELNEI